MNNAMNEETQTISEIIADLTLQLDQKTRTEFCDTFKSALQACSQELLTIDIDITTVEEELFDRILQSIVALSILASNRIDWEQIKMNGLKGVN